MLINTIVGPRYMAPENDAGAAGDQGAGDSATGDQKQTNLLGNTGAGDQSAGDSAAGDKDAGQAGTWSWAEDQPGTGDAPDWFKADKFANISEQAKALTAAEAKIGPAAALLGAPEGDYELPAIPDGITGNWDPKDPMLAKFIEIAKANDFSQEAFNSVLGPMAELIATEAAANETAISDALAALGTNASERLQAVDLFLVAQLGQEGADALSDAIGTDVEAYKQFEKLVGMAAGDAQLSTLPGLQGPGFTKEDIQEEQFKVFPEGHAMAGKSMYENDAAHREKVDGMWKKLFPGDDVQIVA